MKWIALSSFLFFSNVLIVLADDKKDFEMDKYDHEFEDVMEWAWSGEFRPLVEVTYGKAMIKHQKFVDVLPENAIAEVKLGYSQIQKYERMVWELDERFIYGSYISDDLDNTFTLEPGDISAIVRRIGFGNRLGYGYQLGPIELLFYNQNGLAWTKIQTNRSNDLIAGDNDILDRYEGTFRFGMNTEGGLKLQFFKSVALTGSYELAAVYPRHVFWEWLGSYIIMNAGVGLVSVFSDDIIHSSPTFGPIFYFLLKNGISYAFYQGVKDKMNWPFDSETPMTFENIKLGISFTF
jgi:hypothetical protein